MNACRTLIQTTCTVKNAGTSHTLFRDWLEALPKVYITANAALWRIFLNIFSFSSQMEERVPYLSL
jgi:hypothetical protein